MGSLTDGAAADLARRWLEVALRLPWWGGALAAVAGIALLARGNGPIMFRLVAAPLGLACTPWVPVVAPHLGWSELPASVVTAVGAVLALLGLVFPPGVVFFAVGVPFGVLAGSLMGPTDWLLGFLPAFIVGGALGLVGNRVVASILAALVGAGGLVLGVVVALAPGVPSFARVAEVPLVLVAVTACLAGAGAVYQLFVRPPPEGELERRRLAAQKKTEAKEQQAREKRWAELHKEKADQ